MKSTHIFEVPIYLEPSHHFKRFIKERIRHPVRRSSVFVKNQDGKLTFTFRSEEGKESTSSVRLFPSAPSFFKEPYEVEVENMASSFASKVNCTMSLVGKHCDVYFNLVHLSQDKHSDKKKLYGEEAIALLTFTITCRSTAIELALSNFFMVVDQSY